MFNIKEYKQNKDRLAYYLPWSCFVSPSIILNKAGSFQTSFLYRGHDLDSCTENELDVISGQINNALKRLGSKWSIFIEVQRHKFDEYPLRLWDNKTCNIIDNERRKYFKTNQHFESRYYLTFSYIPPLDISNNLTAFFFKNEKPDYKRHLEYFRQTIKNISDILNNVFLELRQLNDDETLTYLYSCISNKRHLVKRSENPIYIDSILANKIMVCGMSPQINNYHLGIIGIKGLPHESYPQIIAELNNLSFEYRWMNRFICLSNDESIRELNKYSRLWFAKRKSLWSFIKESMINDLETRQDQTAINFAQEIDDFKSLISTSAISAGYYTSTFVILDKDQDSLNAKIKEVEQVFNSKGFISVHETFNAFQSWLGSLPGHVWANVRRPIIHSLNLSHFIPVSCQWSGQTKNKHLNDDVLFYARTESNTPFRFCNHIDDVGHTMIIGPTGSGKSIFLAFIASQFLKYKNAQVFIFDYGMSLKAITQAVKGQYYNIGAKDSISFQPFRNVHESNHSKWSIEWLLTILKLENITINPEIKEIIYSSIHNGLKNLSYNERTMNMLVNIIKNFEISKALKNYESLFNSDKDLLSFGKWACFEMSSLMSDMQSYLIPVLLYLFYRIESRLNGSPSMIILDESWLYLDNEVFSGKIKAWLKTLRKKNTSVIFASQSLSDITESSIISTLIESCPTRVFLPNRKAIEPVIKDQYKKLGLNDKQIEIIAYAVSKQDYYCQSNIGERKFQLSFQDQTLNILTGKNYEN